MAMIYHIIAWGLLTLLLLLVLWVLYRIFTIVVYNTNILKKIYYAVKNGNKHLKAVDETLEDTRKEKEYWKKKATKSS